MPLKARRVPALHGHKLLNVNNKKTEISHAAAALTGLVASGDKFGHPRGAGRQESYLERREMCTTIRCVTSSVNALP
jgi:hypothetical protein